MLLNAEHDFAELLAVFEAFVGGGGLGERVDFVDDGMDDFARDEVENGKEFSFAAHVRTKNRLVAAE